MQSLNMTERSGAQVQLPCIITIFLLEPLVLIYFTSCPGPIKFGKEPFCRFCTLSTGYGCTEMCDCLSKFYLIFSFLYSHTNLT